MMEPPSRKASLLVLLFLSTIALVVQYQYNFFTVDCHTRRGYASDGKLGNLRNNTRRGFNVYSNNSYLTRISVEGRRCTPQKYVLFLKTHKTGSSTITNILNRYADRKNMTVLIPKGVTYYSFDWPNKFRLGSTLNLFSRPNFLINHSRYSRKSMQFLFPRESSTYISILRHPVSQWESTFQYMSFPYILNIAHKKDPIDFFLNNFPKTQDITELARKFPSLYLVRNPLLFDLGIDHRYFDDSLYIRRALKTLDKDFDLVLIMEYFDESLTLLRRRLCWDIDDVVNFKLNERLSRNKRKELSETQIEKIKEWNRGDVVLYNYFLERFWREVKNEGPGFYDDVAKLKQRRSYYFRLCIEGEAIEEAYSSVFVKGYKMRSNLTGENKETCKRMLRNELHYLDLFRDRRKKFINDLEGTTIENFFSSTEEVDIFVDLPDLKYTDYIYGRNKKPTRNIIKKIPNFETNKQNTIAKDSLHRSMENILVEYSGDSYDKLSTESPHSYSPDVTS